MRYPPTLPDQASGSLVRPANAASARVARKIGMRPEGEIELLGAPVQVHAYAVG